MEVVAMQLLSRMVSFRCPEELAAALATIPDRDRSEFMRKALERALRRLPPPVRGEAAETKEA
jgi:hypothetical protein